VIIRLIFLVFSLVVTSFGQNLDQLSIVVVYLHRTEQQPIIRDGQRATLLQTNYGTGFLVSPDGNSMFLVTAAHVAAAMQSTFRATIRGDNDTPIDLSSGELVGSLAVTWVLHDTEDIAVTALHPSDRVMPKMKERFLARKAIAADQNAPSRERSLTALGFPFEMGAEGHFSLISRESKPASGLVTLRRPDTHTPAVFFLLDSPSIEGFSGAPLFQLPAPYSSSTGKMIFFDPGTPVLCVGVIHGTLSDSTGGKMAAVIPSVSLLSG
jgi:hypothetical protein